MPLKSHEDSICARCLAKLPRTRQFGQPGNETEKIFWGQIPIIKASSLMYYFQRTDSHNVFRRLKYGHKPQVGVAFGRIMSRELQEKGFFETVDAVVPVPLAKKKMKKRGYNQAEMLALGVCEVTKLPLLKEVVTRTVPNETQTKLSRAQRMDNVKGIFKVSKPDKLQGKHLLLVDDVVTTGATLISCAKAILEVAPTATFSVLTLALAASVTEVPHHELSEEKDTANDAELVYWDT